MQLLAILTGFNIERCLRSSKNGYNSQRASFGFLVVCFFILISLFLISSKALADTNANQQLSQEEVMRLIITQDKTQFLQYINSESSETLNKPFQLNYSLGEISLLSLIVETKDLELIQAALKAGANPDGLISSYKPPLVMAIETEQWDIVELLLEGGANPSLLVNYEQRFYKPVPLFYKVLRENDSDTSRFVEMAVKFNPALVYTDEMKSTEEPHLGYLALALKNQPTTTEVISYLISKGEDPEKKSNNIYEPKTPYQFFLESPIREGTRDEEALNRRQETLKFLLAHGVNALPKNSRGTCYEPLYIAQGNADLVNVLLEKGLDPNKASCFTKSHFGVAAEIADVKTFEILLKAGGKLDRKLIAEIISQKKSKALLEWLQENHAERFEQCKPGDCESYLLSFNSRSSNANNAQYSALIDQLIGRLEGQAKELDNVLNQAVRQRNSIDMANRVIKAGAKFSNPGYTYWQHRVTPSMMSLLIEHKVSPFSKKVPIHEVIDLERVPAEQFSGLLLLLDDTEVAQETIQQWLIFTLSGLSNGSTVDYIDLDRRLSLAKKNAVDLNVLKTKEGTLFIPDLVNQLIEKQESHGGDVKLSWLISKGIKLTEENKAHYIDNDYLRGLFERAGSNPIDLSPQSESEIKALTALVDDNMHYSVPFINFLISIGQLPVNKSVGLKTVEELDDEGMKPYLYACHYSSYKPIWTWLKENLYGKEKQELLSLYQACGAVDLAIADKMKSVSKDRRQDWFEGYFSSTNFELLAIQETSASYSEEENPAPNTSQRKYDDEKVQQLEKVLLAQLGNSETIKSANETLIELKQSGWEAPDDILETLVNGLDQYNGPWKYSDVILLLTELGADPTRLLSGTPYSFMEHLPMDEDNQALFNSLYDTLSITQKLTLWDSFIIRLAMTSSNTYTLSKQALIVLLILWAFFVLTQLLAFISLISFLVKTRKKPTTKALFPSWQIQAVFIAGLVLLIIAIVNAIGIELSSQKNGEHWFVEPYIPWSLWLKSTLVLLLAQFLVLLFLFKSTFINKKHPSITFFVGLMLFSLTLLLPVMAVMLSKFHSSIYFPSYPFLHFIY